MVRILVETTSKIQVFICSLQGMTRGFGARLVRGLGEDGWIEMEKKKKKKKEISKK